MEEKTGETRWEKIWPKLKFWGIAAAMLALAIGLCVSLMQWDVIKEESYQAGYADGHVDGETEGYEDGLAKGKAWVDAVKDKEISRLESQLSEVREEKNALETQASNKDEEIKKLNEKVKSLESQQTITLTESSGASSSSSSTSTRSTPASTGNDYGSWGGEGVYVTNTGSKYHRAGCRYLNNSAHSMSLSQAQAAGYSACSVCW